MVELGWAMMLKLKRGVDVGAAIIGLVITAPVLAVVAFLVRVFLGGPVLFRQVRPGLQGRAFRVCKFSTMTDERDCKGHLLPDEHRLSWLGRFLRLTSLDELPQLWNVLTGDMSLVGPRPLLPQYLPRYNEWQRRRHEVKPGITGWAQVNGRNALSWEQKLDLDVWYVDNWSYWLDLKILWMTVIQVVRRDGISQDGHPTMPEFLGSAPMTERHE